MVNLHFESHCCQEKAKTRQTVTKLPGPIPEDNEMDGFVSGPVKIFVRPTKCV